MRFYYMWKDEPSALVDVDFVAGTVSVRNFTNHWLKRPFGLNESPTIESVEKLFESRTFPRSRADCRKILDEAGIDFYDPIAIVSRTHGLQGDDYAWVKFDGDDTVYDEIKIRD